MKSEILDRFFQKKMDVPSVLGFMEKNYLKNRTIVSQDISGILDDIESRTGLPVIRHEYKTGEDHGTWIVPPEWNVRAASLKDNNEKIIASYEEHPLFVAPYSASVNKTLTKDDLASHVYLREDQPDYFGYNHRLAYDPKKRLNDWNISLPFNLFESLDDGPFEIVIDAEILEGTMLVGEIFLPGKSKETISLLADYCHPGQINDSMSGLSVLMEVVQALNEIENRHYSYNLLIFPETIGAVAYLASNSKGDKNIVGNIFVETVAWGKEWYIKSSRLGNTYMDLIAEQCCRRYEDIKIGAFISELYGNDEIIFDSPQANIPSLALQKYPYDEYHTSGDNLEKVSPDNLIRAYETIKYMIGIIMTA